jgi:hypothetical protein
MFGGGLRPARLAARPLLDSHDRLHRLPVRAGIGARPLAGPLSTLDLFAQAIVEGSVVLLLFLFLGIGDLGFTRALTLTLIVSMLVHVAVIVFENLLASNHTRHRQLAVDAIRRGAFARLFWGGAIAVAVVSIVAAALFAQLPGGPLAAAILALGGSFAWEYVWVEAGQSVPLS